MNELMIILSSTCVIVSIIAIAFSFYHVTKANKHLSDILERALLAMKSTNAIEAVNAINTFDANREMLKDRTEEEDYKPKSESNPIIQDKFSGKQYELIS